MILIEIKLSKGGMAGLDTEGNVCARTCIKCEDFKPVSDFHKNKLVFGGVTPTCKQCRVDWQAARPKSRKRYYKLDDNNKLIERECTDCREIKPASFFSAHSHCPGGIYTVCRVCKKGQDKEHRDENIQQYRISSQVYYQKNYKEIRKRVKEWRKSNPDKITQYDRRVDRTIAVHRAFSKQMRQIKKQVKELNKGKTKALEKVCMDHIIPLNAGDSVSGLNVPWNTQILSWSENAVKSNKFDWSYENDSWKKDYERFIQIKKGEYRGEN